MREPEVWTFKQLKATDIGKAVMWITPSVHSFVKNRLPFSSIDTIDSLPPDAQALLVIGGGVLIDEAKAFRNDRRENMKLITIPSIWGSGAEISPIVVLNRAGKKDIRMGKEFLPDIRVCWPELANSIPQHLAACACGDSWAHAFEGFMSPLAGEALRRKLGELMVRMIEVGIGKNPEWFDLSAKACFGQVQSSVGLIHGIAHTLEGSLAEYLPNEKFGHARLCSLFLFPVFKFNLKMSDKPQRIADKYGLDLGELLKTFKFLFDEAEYDRLLPMLKTTWKSILRDPCTRTNCTLVRTSALSFFEEKRFI
jgi:succinate semialdehyde reductase